MGRRKRKPGPIQEGPTASGRRLFVPGLNPWISVNPVPNGVLPTDVDTLTSDDIDNGTLGVWYYYDPVATTLDVSGHSTDWVIQTANGIEFYADLSEANDGTGGNLQWDNTTTEGGRIATALMKPDGSGQFTFGDLEGGGIEFLIYPGEVSPHDDNEDCGLIVGVAGKDIMDHTGGATEAHIFGVRCTYQSASAGSSAVEGGFINPSKLDSLTGTSFLKFYGQFHFARKHTTNDEYGCGFHLGMGFGTNEDYETAPKAGKQTAEYKAAADKVYLFVGVAATSNNTSASGVLRTGAFKIFYRLSWNKENITPDYVMGGNNQNSGFSSGYFDS